MKNSKTKLNNKVIVVLGPTAAGKTKLAVALAHKFNGEIISADSRQVYRGMDVGTGKDLSEYKIKLKVQNPKLKIQSSKSFSISYHLIDVVSPKKQFTVAQWQQQAYAAIEDILSRGKVPIVVGGTGLYVSALVQGYILPKAQSSKPKIQNVRKKLDKLSLNQLLTRLKEIDPATYQVIDKKNRRRVQRALEIYYQTGKTKSEQVGKKKPPYDFLLLGLSLPKEDLKNKILKRLKVRLEQEGMIDEVKRLRKQGVSWKRLDEFGLEYRFVAKYLQGQLSYEEMVEQLGRAIVHFAKRQMTWFKRDKNIQWIEPGDARRKLKTFLNKKTPRS